MSSLGLANMTGDYHLALHVETAIEMVNLKAAVEQTYTDIDSAWLVICGENGALGLHHESPRCEPTFRAGESESGGRKCGLI